MSLTIIVLTSLERKRQRVSTKGKSQIYVVAKPQDITGVRPGDELPAGPAPSDGPYTFLWIMPPPGKGSGGHLNIFRFIRFLEEAGHTNRIFLYTQGEHGPVSGVVEAMGDSYTKLDATMEWIDDAAELPAADGIFSTSWETAYVSARARATGKRFYFVQDFEPYFYPVGSLYALAENTYKLGFYGVTAGGWLSKKLHEEYGMRTAHFGFGSDPNTYRFENRGARNEILFYVRPYTQRRGFELGILALELFHKQHPEITINLVGWDVSDYEISFPYQNLKTLEIHELSDLYNRCAAGLVLSFTNMSLLPLELLGSGTIPVVNDGPNNRLVSDNPYIAYAAANPADIAKTLSDVIKKTRTGEYATKAAASVTTTGWPEAGATFVDIVEKEMKHRG